jgi:hypothetical protein
MIRRAILAVLSLSACLPAQVWAEDKEGLIIPIR